MLRKTILILLASFCLSSIASPALVSKKVWVTLNDAAFNRLQMLAPQTVSEDSQIMTTGVDENALIGEERIHLVEVEEHVLSGLSEVVHRELHRCGGYMVHESEAAGRLALAAKTNVAMVGRPVYAIDNQATVNAFLPQMQDSHIAQTIADMTSFANRYYTTNNGVNASNWLSQRWQQMSAGRSDITVEQFVHSSWAQKSVVLTIKGTDNASEVVVLGAHLDSINMNGTTEMTVAPGADDDASGIASLTEAIRVMVANGYKPRRTIKFIGYAAEEVGLRGSQDIAKRYKADNVNVVGVMQLDMTNYRGSANDIYIYTDYTDSAQNQFVANLLSTYLPTMKIGYDKCGYACSDHASWSAQGYVTSMPFESSFAQYNPYIHTAKDTYANSGNQALHALKFARMALAYAVELGSDGPAAPPPADKVETFSGSLTKGKKQSYGPFKVANGGSFTATVGGTGDADLYVRRNGMPTTSTYDCKSDGPTSTENCTLSLTANGDVYILLYGYLASKYNLKVTYRSQ